MGKIYSTRLANGAEIRINALFTWTISNAAPDDGPEEGEAGTVQSAVNGICERLEEANNPEAADFRRSAARELPRILFGNLAAGNE